MTVGRGYEFRAVHALTTGPAIERTHGHAYRIEVILEGVEYDALDGEMAARILPHLHGRELNGLPGPSTGEVLVEWIDARLRTSPIGDRLRAVLLFETAKNRFASAKTEERYV